MALIQCPKCGGKLSDRAEKCPHCGYSRAIHNTMSHSNNEQQEVNSDEVRATSRTLHKVLWISLSVVLLVILGIGTYILWMDNTPNAAEETTTAVTEEWQKTTNPYKDGYYKAEWTYKGQWYAVEYELENNAIRSAKFIEQQESHALKCKLAHGEYIKALRPDKSEDDFYFQFSLKNNSGFMKYPTEKDIHVTIYEKQLKNIDNNSAIEAEVEVVPEVNIETDNPTGDISYIETESVKTSDSQGTFEITFEGVVVGENNIAIGMKLIFPSDFTMGQPAHIEGEYWYGNGKNGTLILSGNISSTGSMTLKEYTHEGIKTGTWNVIFDEGPEGWYLDGSMTNSKGKTFKVICSQE